VVTGATRNYNNGPKNHWRRTVWNEVLRRTDGRHKTDPILYLSGPQNIDRDVAVKKGVPLNNLIAIDRCWENVKAVRSAGGSAIHGDALDVLRNWPMARPVSAVLMDFCSGIERSNCDVFDMFQRRPLRGSVIVLNFMRGRDPWSNKWRECIKNCDMSRPLYDERGDVVVEPQNRAYQYLLFHAWEMITMYATGGAYHGECNRALWTPTNERGRTRLRAEICNVIGSMWPTFVSYRSGKLVFDTVIFRHVLASVDAEASEYYVKAVDADVEAKMKRDTAVARKIAATLAVRTMRLNAQ
jgi:hypothetical protein